MPLPVAAADLLARRPPVGDPLLPVYEPPWAKISSTLNSSWVMCCS